MAKCTGCNAELAGDAVFCPQCGTRVAVAAPTSMATAAVATISGMETISGVTVATRQPGLTAGELFHGRYLIERQLGAGAMGVVYVAIDQVTNGRVALKLINPALADRPAARERFVREGLMARDVRHANIVAMYDVGDADGQVYLVMEYLGGETLRKWLRRTLQEGRDVSFETARAIIRNILEGLAAAHATGVVHRDLKPENVMLSGDPEKGDCRLKILDFGIARAIGTTSHLTTTSSSTGTPLYMAPEQKTAADTVGPPADLYAVTAMLYELLMGVAPEGRWNAPSKERADLPPGIDAVIETGLSSRPRSRYQSAGDYIKALDAIASTPAREPGESSEPLPPEEPARPTGPAQSRWSWLGSRSPAWALWGRLSKKQRYIVIAAGLVAVFAFIGYNTAPPEGSDYGVTTPSGDTQGGPPAGQGKPPAGDTSSSSRAADMNIAGRWFDEVAGTGVAIAYVDFVQQGNTISGTIYNSYGFQTGTLRGQVQGTSMQYAYVASNGMTGTGRGRLTADGMHIDVEARDNATGLTERHTLHKNHLPPQ
jgi:serine/threonine protein kinase